MKTGFRLTGAILLAMAGTVLTAHAQNKNGASPGEAATARNERAAGDVAQGTSATLPKAPKPGERPSTSRAKETIAKPVSPAVEDLRRLLKDAKTARTRFVDTEQGLMERIKEARGDLRERLRKDLNAAREAFLEQQRRMREELRQRVIELREELRNHRELLDELREEAKEKVRQRKAGD